MRYNLSDLIDCQNQPGRAVTAITYCINVIALEFA
jgi:hypothetical protein